MYYVQYTDSVFLHSINLHCFPTVHLKARGELMHVNREYSLIRTLSTLLMGCDHFVGFSD